MNRYLRSLVPMLILLAAASPAMGSFTLVSSNTISASVTLVIPSVPADPVFNEALYILTCQDQEKGCFNDVVPASGADWVIPRENGTAIIGLIEAYTAPESMAYGQEFFKTSALMGADYLKSRQETDGGWCFHYDEAAGTRVNKNKSPSSAGSVVMAFYRLMQTGFEDPSHQYYDSAKKGAQFIISCVDNKTLDNGGTPNGLAGAGKEYGFPMHDDGDGLGPYRWSNWSWISDNCYAYLALMCMKDWAAQKGDSVFSATCGDYATAILNGINIRMKNPDNAVWYRVVGGDGNPVPVFGEYRVSESTDALCYYPQKLDVPATEYGNENIAEWMTKSLQKNDETPLKGMGAFKWMEVSTETAKQDRLSQGFSEEAWLALVDIPGAVAEDSRNRAKAWWESLEGTGGNGQLWDVTNGGIVDWYDPDGSPEGNLAPSWQKFIDTSANCIFVYKGGINFNFPLDSQPLSIAHSGASSILPSEEVVVTSGTVTLGTPTNTVLSARIPRKSGELKNVSFYYFNDSETSISTATVQVPASISAFAFRFEVPVNFTKAKYFYYCIEVVDSRGFRTYWPKANSREFYRVDIQALAVASVTADGGTVTLNDGNPDDGVTSLDIPPGALDSSVSISIEEVLPADSSLASGGSLTGNSRPVAVYRFLPEGLVFNKMVTMNLLFKDLDQDGIVDGTTYRENTLRIFWWDGIEWRLVGGEVNPLTNVVSTKLKHFSLYAVFPAGDMTDNDYRPKERIITPASVDTRNDFASFSGIDDIDVINIYDISGKRIRQLRDAYTWDGKDDTNTMVESGLYIYQIKLKTTGKVISGTIAVAK
ncbi:MAG: hypothetical protein ACYC5N_04025 [Endomicrobiales bacterium]